MPVPKNTAHLAISTSTTNLSASLSQTAETFYFRRTAWKFINCKRYSFWVGDNCNPTTQIFVVNPLKMTMAEGETCNLTVTVDPEFSDTASVYLYSSKQKTIVSSDYQVTAYSCGEDEIMVEVSVPDDSSETGNRIYHQEVKIQVQPDETLPAETRSELDRLQAQSPIGDFKRKTLELLGVLNAALYSIVATAQANGLDAERYLTDLFSQPAGTLLLPFDL